MGGELPTDSIQTDPAAPPNPLSNGTPDLSSTNYAFTSGSLSLSLPADKQVEMMDSFEAIFQLDEEASTEDQEMLDDDEEEPQVDLEDQQKRIDKLKAILPIIAQLWWCQSDYMVQATQKLADGSRNRKSKLFLIYTFGVSISFPRSAQFSIVY